MSELVGKKLTFHVTNITDVLNLTNHKGEKYTIYNTNPENLIKNVSLKEIDYGNFPLLAVIIPYTEKKEIQKYLTRILLNLPEELIIDDSPNSIIVCVTIHQLNLMADKKITMQQGIMVAAGLFASDKPDFTTLGSTERLLAELAELFAINGELVKTINNKWLPKVITNLLASAPRFSLSAEGPFQELSKIFETIWGEIMNDSFMEQYIMSTAQSIESELRTKYKTAKVFKSGGVKFTDILKQLKLNHGLYVSVINDMARKMDIRDPQTIADHVDHLIGSAVDIDFGVSLNPIPERKGEQLFTRFDTQSQLTGIMQCIFKPLVVSMLGMRTGVLESLFEKLTTLYFQLPDMTVNRVKLNMQVTQQIRVVDGGSPVGKGAGLLSGDVCLTIEISEDYPLFAYPTKIYLNMTDYVVTKQNMCYPQTNPSLYASAFKEAARLMTLARPLDEADLSKLLKAQKSHLRYNMVGAIPHKELVGFLATESPGRKLSGFLATESPGRTLSGFDQLYSILETVTETIPTSSRKKRRFRFAYGLHERVQQAKKPLVFFIRFDLHHKCYVLDINVHTITVDPATMLRLAVLASNATEVLDDLDEKTEDKLDYIYGTIGDDDDAEFSKKLSDGAASAPEEKSSFSDYDDELPPFELPLLSELLEQGDPRFLQSQSEKRVTGLGGFKSKRKTTKRKTRRKLKRNKTRKQKPLRHARTKSKR